MGVRGFVGGLVRTKTWHDLRDLGNSRLIRTSFIWLILVPAAAKMLQPFVGEYTLTIPELGVEGKKVGIYLPPGWLAFYFMSLCFAVGQATYYIRCPELVRQFANWGEYRAAHKGNDPLIDILAAQLEQYAQADRKELHRRISARLTIQDSLQPHVTSLQLSERRAQRSPMWFVAEDLIALSGMREPVLSDLFSIILQDAQRSRRGSQTLCGWSFRVGFVLFLWTAMVNLWAVCRVLINQWGG